MLWIKELQSVYWTSQLERSKVFARVYHQCLPPPPPSSALLGHNRPWTQNPPEPPPALQWPCHGASGKDTPDSLASQGGRLCKWATLASNATMVMDFPRHRELREAILPFFVVSWGICSVLQPPVRHSPGVPVFQGHGHTPGTCLQDRMLSRPLPPTMSRFVNQHTHRVYISSVDTKEPSHGLWLVFPKRSVVLEVGSCLLGNVNQLSEVL